MSLKYKIIISVVVVLIAFAAGRYSVNSPAVKTTETVTQQDKTVKDTNTHARTTKTETKKPDGTDVIVTVTDRVSNSTSSSVDTTNTQIQQTVSPPKKNTLNISVLGANDFGKGLLAPTYGLAVHKEILGPITVGAFGLMNGTVGVSIGLDF